MSKEAESYALGKPATLDERKAEAAKEFEALTDDQKKAVEACRAVEADCEGYDASKMTDSDRIRFARARDWDVRASAEYWKEHLLWRKAFAVDDMRAATVFSTLSTQLLFNPAVTDKDGCPVIILQPRYLDTKSMTPLQALKAYIYIFEHTVKNMPAGISQFVIINDVNGMLATEFDSRFPKIVLAHVQDHFPGRLKNAMLVNSPWFFPMVFKIVSSFLEPDFKSRAKVVDQSVVHEQFDKAALPSTLGGTAEYDIREWLRERMESEGDSAAAAGGAGGDDDGKTEETSKRGADVEIDPLLETALTDAATTTTREDCDHSGWGTKLGAVVKNWKRRFFVLKGPLIFYYKTESSPKPQGVIVLERTRVQDGTCKGKTHEVEIVTPLRVYHLVVDSAESKEAWSKAIAANCVA